MFDELTALTELNLSGNDLTALPAGVFDELTALTELYLNSNKLAALPDDVFDDLTGLTMLDLADNSLTELSEDVFDSLTSLTTLDLRRNSGLTLPEPGGRVLLPLVSLTTYNGEAYAQPARTDICSRTAEVETAILAAVPFTVACGQVAEASLAQITSLDLSSQSISALASGDFAGLTGLTSLNLSGNDLTTLPVDVFDDLAALETLDLRGNASLTQPVSGDRVLHNLVSLATYNGEEYTQPIRGVCDRTQAVRDAILATSQVNSTDCMVVDPNELAQITSLDLSNKSISALASGDFAGLTGLTTLNLSLNSLTALPEDLFDGLTSLRELNLSRNSLTALTADVFDGLTSLNRLDLFNNSLTALPADVFDDLANLTNLGLSNSSLTTLPPGVFDEQTGLTDLSLNNNSLTGLPEDVFSPLTELDTLNLNDNSLSSLPADVFDDLTSLVRLDLNGNKFATLPEGVFDALAALATLNLTGNASLTQPVSGDRVLLPLVSLVTFNNAFYIQPPRTDICDRTADVELSILVALPFTIACDQVPQAALAEITSLDLSSLSMGALLSGDFAELTGLTTLNLVSNELTGLPEDVFNDLTSLTTLDLQSNELAALPGDVFNDLTSLTTLRLYSNELTALPADVFDSLTSLTYLFLANNSLTTLPETVFDSLLALETLDLRNNDPGWTLPEPGHRVLRHLVRLTTYNGAPYVSPDVSEPPGLDFPDDATTPGKLSVGGSVTGAIKDIEDPPEPADAFLVTLTPGTTYVVDLKGEAIMQDALYYPFLQVYTLNPTDAGSDGGPGRNARVEFKAKSPGKYRIRVSGKSGSTFTYRLSLNEKRDPPGAPSAPSLLVYDSSLIVSWTEPSNDGNSPVTSYDLRHIPSDSPDADKEADANWTVIDTARESGRDLRYQITGLANDTEYDVQVRAVNAKGDGAWSETATGTPEELVDQMGNWCDRATMRTPAKYCDLNQTGRLALGVVSRGVIGEEGNSLGASDKDWFQLTLEAGKMYRIDALGAPSGDGTLADPYLRGLHAVYRGERNSGPTAA